MTIAAGAFARTLVAWQKRQGRHALPWQQVGDARDPYRVWLSEVMLQQTQVASVIPYFGRFVERFPDVRSLAAASRDDVMQAWSGLGYYSRARNLHDAARRVVDVHGGLFPAEPDELARLPGVGRSTAAAIAVFAFGKRAAILDGNVKRVLARVHGVEGVATSTVTTRRLWSLAETLLPARDIESYTQGLMDLGATVCTPRNPACILCPFAAQCVARIEGRIDELPARAARKAVPERRATLLLLTRGHDVLLERRPPAGIWGGLWSLPEDIAVDDPAELLSRVERLGTVVSIDSAPGFTHGFTHFTLHAEVVHARIGVAAATQAVESPDDGVRWVSPREALALGLPAPIRTLLAGRLASAESL